MSTIRTDLGIVSPTSVEFGLSHWGRDTISENNVWRVRYWTEDVGRGLHCYGIV
uniref:Uncharacterized protein n=1 Tax=Lepeophtheirus salmonis TaxID=72036 RepID=A0A0K2VHH1_LEPSM